LLSLRNIYIIAKADRIKQPIVDAVCYLAYVN